MFQSNAVYKQETTNLKRKLLFTFQHLYLISSQPSSCFKHKLKAKLKTTILVQKYYIITPVQVVIFRIAKFSTNISKQNTQQLIM